jgi:uncharacterized protein with HEPN domain
MAPTKSPRLRLIHIRDEIDSLAEALRGASFEEYRKGYALRRATERALQIVSEAAKALPPELLARHPETPWAAIIGLGNILRHEYQSLDDRRLWEIVVVHLPRLREVVARMIDETPPN